MNFSKYPVKRLTTRLNIAYYVKENFRHDYQGSLARLESNIEEEYITSLRHSCYKEKTQSEFEIYTSKIIYN